MTHETYLEMAAAHALGALDPEDRGAFEAHLASCAECRATVGDYTNVAGMLALAAPAAAPPNASALRRRIVQGATGVRPIGTARSAPPSRSVTPWLAVAACLTISAASLAAWRRVQERATRLQVELAAAQEGIARRDSTLAAFFGPEVHVVSLSEPDAKPKMRVYWNHTRNLFIVTAFNVPRAPQGKTYQLWALVNGKAPISMGTFNTDDSGHATQTLDVASSVVGAGHIDNCALTLEPSGGSPQPTETPRLVGAWRHVD